jgi:hypothetical protein
MADVKALGDRTLWLEHGRVIELGETGRVVSKYLAAMVEKDTAYLAHQNLPGSSLPRPSSIAPEIVDHIPNIDHRYGDGRAELLGIAVLDPHGAPLQLLEPSTHIVVRITVRAKAEVAQPNVGFIMRNHLGIDFAGTNTLREGHSLPPLRPGDIHTVDFHLEMPELYPSSFSFSPAIADGPLEAFRVCDMIDNAIAVQMARGDGEVYGFLHLPCRVLLNARLGVGTAEEVKQTS